MKFLIILLSLTGFYGFGQKEYLIDSLMIKKNDQLYLDDYSNLYHYNKQNTKLTKYNTQGEKIAERMLTRPFRLQAISNPLNIILFSENTQQIKMMDTNLNDIQDVDLSRNFIFVKNAYVEDLQNLWLLDDASKKIVQYNHRNNKVISSYNFNQKLGEIIDFLVYEEKIYTITATTFSIHNLHGDQLYKSSVTNPNHLRREDQNIYIFTPSRLIKIDTKNNTTEDTKLASGEIVDKNNAVFLVWINNKFYLYPPDKLKIED